MSNKVFPRKSCRLCHNVKKKCSGFGEATDYNIIRRMRFACQTIKSRMQTHTLIVCNIYCFSTATMISRTRLSVTLYLYCPSCLVSEMYICSTVAALWISGAINMFTGTFMQLKEEVKILKLLIMKLIYILSMNSVSASQ